MANTINDLYLKYAKNVGKLENDRYFQYLYQIIEAGDNTLKQHHQIMHKVVDEKWLSTIEDSLDAINRIIEKPRRFVARKEEVVPVALAKKITADSVRHLSMHTQFIASAENGENIQPTHILNVSNEESFDLYENRFIYHLIIRLVTFIDKRTDIIFWSSGDETRNTFQMESKIDDAYEQIEYKVEMTIKNRQNFMEADADNMNIFMRIDRVRRLVMAIRNSSFCDLMSGCTKVRSPIQRTNLLMKDPDYRKCYQLWQFLESYDDVGYSIDVQSRSLEFDEEYLIQMYTNLITNYTVFKTITEEDERKLNKIPPKRRRVLKPKFIRKVEEQIVDDYDLPDVEVKQVIVEEVTKAQLEAEARLAEEIKAREHAEAALDEAEDTIRDYMMKAESALDAMAQAKEKEFAAVKMHKKVSDELAEATSRIKTLEEESALKLESLRKESEDTVSALKAESEAKLQQLKDETDAAYEEQKNFYTDFIASQKLEMDQQLSEMVKSHADELEAQKAASDSLLVAQKVAADAALAAQKHNADAQMQEYIAASEEKLLSVTQKAAAELKQYKERSADEISEIKERNKAEVSLLKETSASEIERIQNEANNMLVAKEEELETVIAELLKEKEALLKAKQELEYENAQLELKLSRETEAYEQAAARAEHESKLRELIEERAGSETIGDFIARSRAEKRERRKQENQ